jgi:hypothetical protein
MSAFGGKADIGQPSLHRPRFMSTRPNQLMRCRSERGVPGARGPKGEPAPQIAAWKIDSERYRAVPFYSDGQTGTGNRDT